MKYPLLLSLVMCSLIILTHSRTVYALSVGPVEIGLEPVDKIVPTIVQNIPPVIPTVVDTVLPSLIPDKPVQPTVIPSTDISSPPILGVTVNPSPQAEPSPAVRPSSQPLPSGTLTPTPTAFVLGAAAYHQPYVPYIPEPVKETNLFYKKFIAPPLAFLAQRPPEDFYKDNDITWKFSSILLLISFAGMATSWFILKSPHLS